MQENEFLIRVLFRREDDGNGHEGWVAQCLEYDLVAQGNNLKEVRQRLCRTMFGQMLVDIKHGREPLGGIGPAPQEYCEKFNEQFAEAVPLERQPQSYIPEAFKRYSISEDMRVYA